MSRPRRSKDEPIETEPEVPSPRLRLAHPSASEKTYRHPRKPPMSWGVIVPTVRRERAIEGMIYGCAVAEVAAHGRPVMHPRGMVRAYGDGPENLRIPSGGMPRQRTHALIMTVQAILESKTDADYFARRLATRIAWYQRSHVLHHFSSHLFRWLNPIRSDAMAVGLGDDPIIRSVTLSMMLQGNDSSAMRWVNRSTQISHADPRASYAAALAAYAGQYAQVGDINGEITPIEILEGLTEAILDEELQSTLIQLTQCLKDNATSYEAACKLGFENGLPKDLWLSAALGVYGWLRYFGDYPSTIAHSILIGGRSRSAAILAGTLAGMSHGVKSIPENWIQRLSWFPYDLQWREELIERVRDWPHGAEDIQDVSPLAMNPLGQLIRNSVISTSDVVVRTLRIPMKLYR